MSRRTGVVLLLISVAVAAGGFVLYRSRTVVVTQPQAIFAQVTATAPGGPTPLPDSFESAGLVMHRDGALRIYVAVPREIILVSQAGGGPGQPGKLASIPISVILENDTYRKLDAIGDLSLTDELFTLTIIRDGSDGREIFSHRELRSGLSGWQPAERKTFKVSWPAATVGPGVFVVSVRPAYGKQTQVQIRTSLK